MCDNILEFIACAYSIMTGMSKDPLSTEDDANEGIPWWGWLLFGIGAALVVAAATVLTLGAFGIAAGGLVGAVLHGAAVGTLIGAGAGAAIGAGAGAIYAGVTGSDMLTSILTGGMTGFGIGAVIGAVIGGAVGGVQFGTFSSAKALNAHYSKHGVKMGFANAKEYAKGAKYVIKNGTQVKYLYKGKLTTGYIRFFGKGGGANYAFVGMNGTRTATFGMRRVADLIKMGITFFVA